MIARSGSRPYLRWLLTREAFPAVWHCLLVMSILWAVSLGAMLRMLGHAPTRQSPAAYSLWMLGIGTAVGMLAGATVVSVLLTRREVQGERRQLLRLANYPSRQLVRDYSFAALYQLRGMLVLATGLSSTLVAGWAHYLISFETIRRCTLSVQACQSVSVSIQPAQYAALVAISVLVSLTLLVMTLACCAIGVWMTLRWQEIGLALAASLGLLAVGLVPLLLFFVLYIDAALHIVIRYDSSLSIALTLPVIAVMGAIPHLLVTDTGWHRARRWAWHNLTGRGGPSDHEESDPTLHRSSDHQRGIATPAIFSLWRRHDFPLLPRTARVRDSSRHTSVSD